MPRVRIPYSRRELLGQGPQPPHTGRQLDEIAFPLGGIGTGSISLGGWGQLRDWEIMNRPAKGAGNADAFFTLRVQVGSREPIVRVLQGPAGDGFVGDGHSAPRGAGQGLPHFHDVSFAGEFPMATVRLKDRDVPVSVTLEAFNPFIPLNENDSGVPVAILLYHLRNTGKQPVSATVFGNLTNVIGPREGAGRVNEAKSGDGIKGLNLTARNVPEDSPAYGSMALAALSPDVEVWTNWTDDGRGRMAKFWETVTAWSDGTAPPRAGGSATGSVAVRCHIKPGETVTVPFLLTWYFPVFEHWRKQRVPGEGDEERAPKWRNYYASLWRDAWDVASYVARELDRLHAETKLFRDTLFASTLPTYVLDAVSSQISTLKTPTCLRLEDGAFYGFEGCSNTVGCCEGSCTHVWNYAQALPYLFPSLQRSMLEAHYANCLEDDGYMTFRMPLPLGTKASRTFHPAADGQMGTVLQVYREWLICGDDAWLRARWPEAKRALEFAWKYWDADKDGVMEGMQHNTYDIEFFGPNTMSGSLYLGALRAAAEMARRLGENDKADEYHALVERGSAWTDEQLWNGSYYEQQVNPTAHEAWPEVQRTRAERHGKDDKFPDWPKWQYGKGCISDQLIGQWYAEMLGLRYLYKRANVRRALQSIFKYNWRPDLTTHPCLLRIYAQNDEAGLLIGTWPRGERPGYAFYFSDEVWCGIEYQVASHLIYEGFVKEGLAIVKGARDRYTGERRNPWNEIECGHHYARSMASYAVLTALCGFSYSAPEQRLGFAPRLFERDFRAFFSVGSGWGQYAQKAARGTAELSVAVKYGSLTLKHLSTSLDLRGKENVTATIGRRRVGAQMTARRDGTVVTFEEPITIERGQTLVVRIR